MIKFTVEVEEIKDEELEGIMQLFSSFEYRVLTAKGKVVESGTVKGVNVVLGLGNIIEQIGYDIQGE